MSNVKKFISKAERIAVAKAAEARQAVLDLELPQRATEEMLIAIQRHETGGRIADWSFNMISPAQSLLVWQAIQESPRPLETSNVFFIVLTHIETNTGLVTLTREEIADLARIAPCHVSSAMGWLEQLGAITRERVRVPGMKGPGKARYRLNPHVGWNGSLEQRKVHADERALPQLPFDVIEGGQHDTR